MDNASEIDSVKNVSDEEMAPKLVDGIKTLIEGTADRLNKITDGAQVYGQEDRETRHPVKIEDDMYKELAEKIRLTEEEQKAVATSGGLPTYIKKLAKDVRSIKIHESDQSELAVALDVMKSELGILDPVTEQKEDKKTWSTVQEESNDDFVGETMSIRQPDAIDEDTTIRIKDSHMAHAKKMIKKEQDSR